MKGKPDINKFLAGAATNERVVPELEEPSVVAKPIRKREAPVKRPAVAPAAPIAPLEAAADATKFTKSIRLTKESERLLKQAAYERSMALGRRVTESDLIEIAIQQYLRK